MLIFFFSVVRALFWLIWLIAPVLRRSLLPLLGWVLSARPLLSRLWCRLPFPVLRRSLLVLTVPVLWRSLLRLSVVLLWRPLLGLSAVLLRRSLLRLSIPVLGWALLWPVLRITIPARATLSRVAALALRSALLLIAFIVPPFAAGLFQATQAYLPHHIHIGRFNFYRLFANHFHSLQFLGPDALPIERLDFLHPFNRERVLLGALGKGIPHQVAENIFFHEERAAAGYFDHITIIGKML
jgi:hypothetical protein